MPSATHLHLMINHLPLFGGAIAVVLLAWAYFSRSRDLMRAAFVLVVACGLGAIAARQSGHESEEQVGHLPWADRRQIHEHEEAGDKTFVIMSIGALLAVVALVRQQKGKDVRRDTAVLFAVMLFGTMAAAWAAVEGGRIRHEEVRPGFVFPPGADDDHD